MLACSAFIWCLIYINFGAVGGREVSWGAMGCCGMISSTGCVYKIRIVCA